MAVDVLGSVVAVAVEVLESVAVDVLVSVAVDVLVSVAVDVLVSVAVDVLVSVAVDVLVSVPPPSVAIAGELTNIISTTTRRAPRAAVKPRVPVPEILPNDPPLMSE
ncbi:MAG: hypothetical protein M3021_06485 [Actinomycetota bacterium]|nr:hypothetical protein [Actinomycetota bacterium]